MKLRFLILFLFFSFACCASDFNRYFPTLIKIEGDYFTITKHDNGGATKFGITIDTYKQYCTIYIASPKPCDKNKDGVIDAIDLSRTTLNDVKPIYKNGYWDLGKCDFINSQSVAEMIADMFVHSGSGYKFRHIKYLQKLVGVPQDGKIGQRTIKAINLVNPHHLFKNLFVYRALHYKKIVEKNPTQKKFLKGWYNRLNTIKLTNYETFV